MKPGRLLLPVWLASLVACAGGDPLSPVADPIATAEPPAAWTASPAPGPDGHGNPDPEGGEHGSGN